jgi:hypothetical protein
MWSIRVEWAGILVRRSKAHYTLALRHFAECGDDRSVFEDNPALAGCADLHKLLKAPCAHSSEADLGASAGCCRCDAN